jgi:ubiquinone/menaquinone biosynthesis C-methylase UbiE
MGVVAGDIYTHGHHESVLRSHRWRTADNSAAYLLPHLQPGLDLLDVGCGPGNLTVDLAGRVAPGRTVGIDAAADVVATASAEAPPGVEIRVGDVYALEDPDDHYDVVHAHQVLQHLVDPVSALAEMRRVTRRGGIVAARDSDYSAMRWDPPDPRLDRWMELYHQITARNEAEADAGRFLLGWAHRAGFSDVTYTTSTWTFADPGTRTWWSDLWADRVRESAFAEQAVAYGLAERAELDDLAGGFTDWAASPDAVFVVLHGEILARA